MRNLVKLQVDFCSAEHCHVCRTGMVLLISCKLNVVLVTLLLWWGYVGSSKIGVDIFKHMCYLLRKPLLFTLWFLWNCSETQPFPLGWEPYGFSWYVSSRVSTLQVVLGPKEVSRGHIEGGGDPRPKVWPTAVKHLFWKMSIDGGRIADTWQHYFNNMSWPYKWGLKVNFHVMLSFNTVSIMLRFLTLLSKKNFSPLCHDVILLDNYK